MVTTLTPIAEWRLYKIADLRTPMIVKAQPHRDRTNRTVALGPS